MDEFKLPVGVGDHLIEQMIERLRPDRKITLSVGGLEMFKGMIVTLDDLEHNVHIRRGVIMQDLEHIDWVLDDMEYQLNSLIGEDRWDR